MTTKVYNFNKFVCKLPTTLLLQSKTYTDSISDSIEAKNASPLKLQYQPTKSLKTVCKTVLQQDDPLTIITDRSIAELFEIYNVLEYLQLFTLKQHTANLIRDFLSVAAPPTVKISVHSCHYDQMETIYTTHLPNDKKLILQDLLQQSEHYGYNFYLYMFFFSDQYDQLRICCQNWLKQHNDDLTGMLINNDFTQITFAKCDDEKREEEEARESNIPFDSSKHDVCKRRQLQNLIEHNIRLMTSFSTNANQITTVIHDLRYNPSRDQLLKAVHIAFPVAEIKKAKIINSPSTTDRVRTMTAEQVVALNAAPNDLSSAVGMTIGEVDDLKRQTLQTLPTDQALAELFSMTDPLTLQSYFMMIDDHISINEIQRLRPQASVMTSGFGNMNTCDWPRRLVPHAHF